mmetsp:Transcript_8374/g.35046  ORF Transcript_8374/g.35046 Transcript_8374/m.35046 type:complete len:190 (+) Transcript_8374:19-588(+)
MPVTKEQLEDRKKELRPDIDYDVFKDSYVRYVGYTNEIGEAMRPVIPRLFVNASYAVAIGYALADTVHKGSLAYKNGQKKDLTPSQCWRLACDSAGYTAVWQTLASVVVPPFFIHKMVNFSRYLLRNHTSLPQSTRRWISVGCGIGIIPLIIHPIDYSVHWFMENSYNPVSARYLLFDRIEPDRQEEWL